MTTTHRGLAVEKQLRFEDAGVPYVRGSTTSRNAARALRDSGAAENLQAETLWLFKVYGDIGLTDLELDAAGRDAGLRFSTLRPRRVALFRKGQIQDSGRRRRTHAGREATVWRITAEGLAAVRQGGQG